MVDDIFNIFIPHIILAITIICQSVFGMLKPHGLIFKYKNLNIVISNTISIAGISAAIIALIFSSGEYVGFNYSIMVTPLVKYLSLLILLCGLSTVFLDGNLLRDNRQSCYKFNILLLTGLLGALCMLGANDFLTLFVSLETLSFSLYLLISFSRGYPSKESGFKYLIVNAVSTAFLLFGVSYLLGLTSSLNFIEITQILESDHNGIIYTISAIMIFAGLAMKLAIFPFANWIIDVFDGCDIAVLNYLSTVPKIAVVGVFMRLFYSVLGYSFELSAVILLMALITAFWANIYAIKSNNSKKLLACSSSSNAAYMLATLSVVTDVYSAAVLFYLVCYIFMNIGCWAYLNTIESKVKSFDLEDLSTSGNLLNKICFIICIVGIAGLPVTSGFVAKIYLLYALLASGLLLLPIIFILIILFTIALYYYIKLARSVISSSNITKQEINISKLSLVTLYSMTVITIILGLIPFNVISECVSVF